MRQPRRYFYGEKMKQTFSLKGKTIEFLKVMLPILISQVAVIAAGFFNMVMAGHLSDEDLAGVSFSVNLYLPFFTSLMGVISALTPIIARYYGAGKYQNIGFETGQGIYWSLLLAFIFVAMGYIALPLLLPLLSLAPAVEQITKDYLFYFSFGIPIFFVFVALKNLIDAHGKTRLTMAITLTTVPINIVLNYIFMYGAFGMESYGGAGAGIGTAITYCITFLMAATIVLFMKPFSNYKIFRMMPKPQFRIWKNHLKLGLPIGGAIFCENSIFGAVGVLMTIYGTTVMAAHQVTMNFTTLIYMTPLSVSFALAILVGYEVGAKRFNDAKTYITIGRVWAILFIAAITAFAFQFREEISAVYTSSPKILEILPMFLLYGAFMQVADSINAPLQGALRGYKDVNAAFFLSLISYWIIGLPLGFFLANYTDFSYYGFWVGLIAGVGIGAIFLSFRLKKVQKSVATN